MNRDRVDLSFDPATMAFGDEPFAWRLPVPEQGLTWRLAQFGWPRQYDDMPQLQKLWGEMDRKVGRQDRPDLRAPAPVVLTLVAVDDVTGEILSAVYGEAVVDWTMIGTSRRVARTIDKLHPYCVLFLFGRGIRFSRIVVPRRLEKHMAKMMPQMANITHSFAQFVYAIRL